MKTNSIRAVACIRFVRALRASTSKIISLLLKGCWPLLQWPCRRLSRHRSDIRCNTATRPVLRVPTKEHNLARQEFRRRYAEKETTQLTKKDSGISAHGLLVGSERENSRSLVVAARHLFVLMRRNEHCPQSSHQRRMRLLVSETGSDTLPVPYDLGHSCLDDAGCIACPNVPDQATARKKRR